MNRSGPPARRTPLRAKKGLESITPLRRTGPPAPMSEKRRGKTSRRQLVRNVVTLRDKECRGAAMGYEHVCWHPPGEPLDVHEIIPRSAWADGFLYPDNCILLCRRAHDWVGDHPDDAALIGLHGYSWQRPHLTPTEES